MPNCYYYMKRPDVTDYLEHNGSVLYIFTLN